MKTISLVIPFYNEGATVLDFFEKIFPITDKIEHYSFEFVCVDDGSKDNTYSNLLKVKDKRIKIIQLSRNFRKEAAITAGIDFATGDAVIPIDADLQDPPELISTMLQKWEEGFEVVLAKRKNRLSDSWLKRNSAKCFYKIHNCMSDFDLPENIGDFRLMDRIVVEALKKLPERQRFMKGLFAWIGFKSTTIEFNRPQRISGTTKWSKWKLWNFALDGITSFSTLPLRIWSYLGVFLAMVAFLYGSWIAIRALIGGVDLPGYASLFVAVLFIGGIQLIGIGVLGEYLGRAYQETKQRPIYLVRKIINNS
jgi:glycosyltransferase involved in cell wall biosynthesis